MSDLPQSTATAVAVSKADLPPGLDQLTTVQQDALEELVQGNSVTGAAVRAGVTRATVYRWINCDPNFRALYNQWLDSARQSCHSRLMYLAEIATDVMDSAVRNSDIKVAGQILKGMGMLNGKSEHADCDPHQIHRDMHVSKLEKDIELLQRELTALKSPVHLIGQSFISDWYVCVRPQPPRTMVDLYIFIDSLNRKFNSVGTGEQRMLLIPCDDEEERASLIQQLTDQGYDARDYYVEPKTPDVEWNLSERKQ